MRVLLLVLALLLPASAQADVFARLDTAVKSLKEIGPHVPASWRTNADCVSVFRVGKGGFIVGGTGGRGFLSCKTKKGTWSAPVVLDIGGTSAGAQIGGGQVDIVMVYRNLDHLKEATHATPVFGAKAEVVAGDQSQGISIGGNPEVDAGVLTLSRSKGLYAGGTLEAVVVDPHDEATAELHGGPVDLEATLVQGTTPVPARAAAFHAAVVAWASGR